MHMCSETIPTLVYMCSVTIPTLVYMCSGKIPIFGVPTLKVPSSCLNPWLAWAHVFGKGPESSVKKSSCTSGVKNTPFLQGFPHCLAGLLHNPFFQGVVAIQLGCLFCKGFAQCNHLTNFDLKAIASPFVSFFSSMSFLILRMIPLWSLDHLAGTSTTNLLCVLPSWQPVR